MAWRQKITDGMADILRFFVRGALLVDGLALAAASVYVVVRICWHFVRYLDRTIFAHPW